MLILNLEMPKVNHVFSRQPCPNARYESKINVERSEGFSFVFYPAVTKTWEVHVIC